MALQAVCATSTPPNPRSPLAQAAETQESIEKREHFGKIVFQAP
jgi:hypothetical protein